MIRRNEIETRIVGTAANGKAKREIEVESLGGKIQARHAASAQADGESGPAMLSGDADGAGWNAPSAPSLTLDEAEMDVLRRFEKVRDKSKLTKADQLAVQHINGKIRRANGLMRKMRAAARASRAKEEERMRRA